MMKNQKKNTKKLLLNKFIQYGLHIGDTRFRCSPKTKPYLLGFRNGFSVINLNLTYFNFRTGLKFLFQLVSSNKKILFIGSPLGMEKDFSLLCTKYGHCCLNSYTNGLFTNYSKHDLKILPILSLENRPSLVFFFDVSSNAKIIEDIKRLNIPTMAFVGANDNIEGIDYVIPSNINSWKGGLFVFNVLSHVLSSSRRIFLY